VHQRQPARQARVAQIGDPDDLAACLLEVLSEPDRYRGDIAAIKKAYNLDSIAAEYEQLFYQLMRKKR
jgi:glycosyltransferase involved in cell wall biosynthesis